MSVDPAVWWEGPWHQPTAFYSIPFPANLPDRWHLTGVVRGKSRDSVDRRLSKLTV